MPDPVDRILDLLDLEPAGPDAFVGATPSDGPGRLFGGQVASQSLRAATLTVDGDRAPHSLHAYFIRPGDPAVPIIYTVERVRDGRTFTTRRVSAIQHGKTIFTLSASFQQPEEGLEHQAAMPAVPPPEDVERSIDRLERLLDRPLPAEHRDSPIELRHAGPLSIEVMRDLSLRTAHNNVWLRVVGSLPDDPLLHVCLMTYVSDLTLLDTVLLRHGSAWADRKTSGASLDHAMWFHRPFRADRWLLYAQETPVAAGGRGLAWGQVFTESGELVVSVVQEGLIRIAGSSAGGPQEPA